MKFEKPKDLKYTDLCIYIDTHAYERDCDDELLYQYLWALVNALVRKHCHFTDIEDYEQFTFYAANFVYLRLKDDRQFELKNDGTPKLKPIKSVLNYIKKTLHWTEIRYMQSKSTIKELAQEENPLVCCGSFHDVIDASLSGGRKVEFDLYLDDIGKTIKSYLKKTPYNGTRQFNALYMSCLLSLLNLMTLRKSSIEYLSRDYSRATITEDVIDDLYKKELEDFVILYHLDQSMSDYVRVLTLRIRDIVADDLSYILHSSPYSECDNELVLKELLREIG